jgi:hypothetical protein
MLPLIITSEGRFGSGFNLNLADLPPFYVVEDNVNKWAVILAVRIK